MEPELYVGVKVPTPRFQVGQQVQGGYGQGVVVGINFLPLSGLIYDVFYAQAKGCNPCCAMRHSGLLENSLRVTGAGT